MNMARLAPRPSMVWHGALSPDGNPGPGGSLHACLLECHGQDGRRQAVEYLPDFAGARHHRPGIYTLRALPRYRQLAFPAGLAGGPSRLLHLSLERLSAWRSQPGLSDRAGPDAAAGGYRRLAGDWRDAVTDAIGGRARNFLRHSQPGLRQTLGSCAQLAAGLLWRADQPDDHDLYLMRRAGCPGGR